MSMINCPECGASISDKALSCTQCGFCGEDRNLPISVQCNEVIHIAVIEDEEGNSFPISFPEFDISEIDLLSKENNYKFVLPAAAEAIKSLVGNKEFVAVIDKQTKEMLKNGELKLSIDKSGKILPTLRKNGKFFKQLRLEERVLSPDLLSCLTNLAMQMQFIEIRDKMESIEESIYSLHIEMQADRYAKAKSAWDELEQAKAITDRNSKRQAIHEAIRSATESKCVLMENFKIKNNTIIDISKMRRWKKSKKKNINKMESTAKEALKVLFYLFRTVKTECEGYLLLNESKAYYTALNEFKCFIEETPLNEDTLRRINGCLSTNEDNVINGLLEIVKSVNNAQFNLEQQEYQKLTDDLEGGEKNE